jgi:hypothetical protein
LSDLGLSEFSVPPGLLPIFQAAGTQYQVPWQVLAAINQMETDYGRNLSISSAGAMGWMQFMPQTWQLYAVDADGDGRPDPYSPADAIFTAARYLKAAGADHDIRAGIFAYNHADWYVNAVLLRAHLLEGLDPSLLQLAGGHFPVFARAIYADDLLEHGGVDISQGPQTQASPSNRTVDIFAAPGSPVIAATDGRIEQIGKQPDGRNYLVLKDSFGNSYRYTGLGRLLHYYPHVINSASQNPQRAAEDGLQVPLDYFAPPYRDGKQTQQFALDPLAPGAEVLGGTVLGDVAPTGPGQAPNIQFAITPAGRGADLVDPKTTLDGWRLREIVERNRDSHSVLLGQGGVKPPSPSDPALLQRVLSDQRIDIYPCGRGDIQSHKIDGRVLAVLEYLADSGLRPTVSSLKCGHSTSAQSTSTHAAGAAVDISAINGIPVEGNQQPGGITDQAVRRVLALPADMQPQTVGSLLSVGGASVSSHDDYNHIHVGYSPKTASADPFQRGFDNHKPSENQLNPVSVNDPMQQGF